MRNFLVKILIDRETLETITSNAWVSVKKGEKRKKRKKDKAREKTEHHSMAFKTQSPHRFVPFISC